MDKIYLDYADCNLCARKCGVNRSSGELGYCGSGADVRISRASLHEWEEPIISGSRGSGTIFFSGCSLGCIYCQNRAISRGGVGRVISVKELSEVMLGLQERGAHNINLVTPTHYVPSIIESVQYARLLGLSVPIVYNTGSYDTVDTVRRLANTVDVYLPDLKYVRADTARRLSYAADYPEIAMAAIDEMHKQQPIPVIKDGIMLKGVIVRILLLPRHVAEAKLALKRVYDAYGDSVYVSLMNQYTPMPEMQPPLDRTITRAEYRELVDYALRLGVSNAFVQEEGTQSQSFIPDFEV